MVRILIVFLVSLGFLSPLAFSEDCPSGDDVLQQNTPRSSDDEMKAYIASQFTVLEVTALKGYDEPISGVPVQLLDEKTGRLLSCSATAANGKVDFLGIIPGRYKVVLLGKGDRTFDVAFQGNSSAITADLPRQPLLTDQERLAVGSTIRAGSIFVPPLWKLVLVGIDFVAGYVSLSNDVRLHLELRDRPIQDLYKIGQNSLVSRNYFVAKGILTEVISKDPGNEEAIYHRGVAIVSMVCPAGCQNGAPNDVAALTQAMADFDRSYSLIRRNDSCFQSRNVRRILGLPDPEGCPAPRQH